MFYVCEKKGNKWGIKDTKDNTVEYYTEEEIIEIVSNGWAEINGVTRQGISIVNPNKKPKILHSKDLAKLLQVVEKYSAGTATIQKITQYCNNGYRLVVRGQYWNHICFDGWRKEQLAGFSSANRLFSVIKEYIDEDSKLYYVEFGDVTVL